MWSKRDSMIMIMLSLLSFFSTTHFCLVLFSIHLTRVTEKHIRSTNFLSLIFSCSFQKYNIYRYQNIFVLFVTYIMLTFKQIYWNGCKLQQCASKVERDNCKGKPFSHGYELCVCVIRFLCSLQLALNDAKIGPINRSSTWCVGSNRLKNVVKWKTETKNW